MEMIRRSTGMRSLPPRRVTLFSWMARSSLAWISGDISPISSRTRVPPEASSSLPILRRRASVNAPASWPNISLSSSGAGMAEQFTAT